MPERDYDLYRPIRQNYELAPKNETGMSSSFKHGAFSIKESADHTCRHVLAVSTNSMAVGNSEIYPVLLTWLMVNDSLISLIG